MGNYGPKEGEYVSGGRVSLVRAIIFRVRKHIPSLEVYVFRGK